MNVRYNNFFLAMMRAALVVVLASFTVVDLATAQQSYEVIDFETMPDTVRTNIAAFPVTGRLPDTTAALYIQDEQVEFDHWSLEYFAAVDLVLGNNPISVRIVDQDQSEQVIVKHIEYDPSYSTASKALVYTTSKYDTADGPQSGVLVIDLAGQSFLGIIKDKSVHGILPDGDEIVVTGGERISTTSHTSTGQVIPSCCWAGAKILFSADGQYAFTCNFTATNKVNLTSGVVEQTFPIGLRAAGIATDGTLIVTPDGDIDVLTNEVIHRSYEGLRVYLGDFVFDPVSEFILASSYSFASGQLNLFRADDRSPVDSYGMGDFTGDIVFSPDGRTAYAGFNGNPFLHSGGILVVDLDTLESRRVTRNGAMALAQSPDGRIYASATFTRFNGAIYGDRDIRGIVEFAPDQTEGLRIDRVFFANLYSTIGSSNHMKQSVFYKPASAAPCLSTTDLSNWQRNLGVQSGARLEDGDFDGDGDVDGRDFLYWQANSGSCSSAAEVAHSARDTELPSLAELDEGTPHEFAHPKKKIHARDRRQKRPSVNDIGEQSKAAKRKVKKRRQKRRHYFQLSR